MTTMTNEIPGFYCLQDFMTPVFRSLANRVLLGLLASQRCFSWVGQWGDHGGGLLQFLVCKTRREWIIDFNVVSNHIL